MSQYSTGSITTPGQRPVRVDFNETERGTFVASVKDSLDGFAIRAFSTVEISRAEAAKPTKAQALALYKAHGKLLRAAVKGKLQGTGQTPAEWLKIEAAVRPEWFIKFTAEVVRNAESWG